jgi:microcompartment protein CcmL/EutN
MGQDRQRSGHGVYRRVTSAAVKAAIDAGAAAAAKLGTVISVEVIPRPNEELTAILPKAKTAPAPAKK